MTSEESSMFDYTSVQEKLLSMEVLSDDDCQKILDVGLQFASDLVKQNEEGNFSLQNQDREFKKFLAVVVFFRMVRLAGESRDKKLHNTDSTKIYYEFKNYCSKELLKDIGGVNDDYFISVLGKCEDQQNFDISDIIERNIDLIRKYASQIVPNNPQGIQKSIEYAFD